MNLAPARGHRSVAKDISSRQTKRAGLAYGISLRQESVLHQNRTGTAAANGQEPPIQRKQVVFPAQANDKGVRCLTRCVRLSGSRLHEPDRRIVSEAMPLRSLALDVRARALGSQRFDDQGLQYVLVDIRELLNVEAALAGRMLAKFCKQRRSLTKPS
jgi:hypothetical protein